MNFGKEDDEYGIILAQEVGSKISSVELPSNISLQKLSDLLLQSGYKNQIFCNFGCSVLGEQGDFPRFEKGMNLKDLPEIVWIHSERRGGKRKSRKKVRLSKNHFFSDRKP